MLNFRSLNLYVRETTSSVFISLFAQLFLKDCMHYKK